MKIFTLNTHSLAEENATEKMQLFSGIIEQEQPEIMDYVRDILFGNVNGQTLHSYWAKNNTPYCVVDLRAGVKIMKGLSFQFMVNNLFNKEYSTRPMLVSAPRTYVMQLSANF